MKRSTWLVRGSVWLAGLGMILPEGALAAAGAAASQPATSVAAPQGAVTDVQLDAGGVLRGQLVDPQGKPVAGATVGVWQQEKQLALTMTDGQGDFAIEGLRGGVYRLSAGKGGGMYRCWANQTSPPGAQSKALLVNGGTVVRGQGPVVNFLTNPWVLVGLVGAAIAIPIALANNDDAS